jgi:general secretion pathway protein D
MTVKSVYTVVALVGIGLMITGVAVMSQESKPAGGGAPAAAAAPKAEAPAATAKPAEKPADKPQDGAAAEKPAAGAAAAAKPAGESKPAAAVDPNAPKSGAAAPAGADPNAPKPGDEKPWSFDDLEKVPTTPLTPGEPMESVNLNNVEMRIILQKLGEWTGKPIIPSNDEVMKLRITIYASQQLPRSSALSLVYAALRSRGIIAEHYDDKIILKPIAQARQGYIPTVSSAEPLVKFADKSQIVEKFFRLQSYSPTRLVEVISPLIADYGHITALENTRDIVVIDTVENLIRIEQIIKQLDVPESEKVVEQVFEIKNTDPGEIVQVLQLILTDLKGGTRARGNRGQGGQQTAQPETPRPQQQPGQRSGGPGANANPAPSVTIPSDTVPIKLIAMPKQGWIIARGTNEDIDLVAEWIKKLDIPETVPTGQTVVPVKYVDPREVANIIQNALQDMPGDVRANIVVQALSQSKQVVIFGSEENRKMVERLIAEVDLPSQNIYSQRTFTLKHADPDQIKTNIDSLFDGSTSSSGRNMGFGGFGGYGGFGRSSQTPDQVVKTISYPTLKQVTVIASEENLKKIADLIEKQWDVPLDITKDQYRLITLKNSDPVQMTDLLTKLFTAESTGSGNSNLIRMIFGGSGSEDEKKKIVGSLYGMLTFEAVPGTKKLIVISKIPEAYEVIEKLVLNLDREEKAEVPTVVTLKYADAEDLCEQLNAMLNEAGTTATIRRSSRGLTTSTTSSSNSSQGTASSISSGQETSSEMITPWWNRQRTTTTTAMPTSNLIGQVRFVPVHRSKAIMILSPPEYLEDLTKLITELDKPGMQVMVKVVIVEVNLKKATSIGVQLASDPSAFGTLGVNAVEALTSLSSGGARGGFALGATGANNTTPSVQATPNATKGFGSVSSTDISVLVDLLVEHANGRVLNQPTLWTKDNEEATFIKGEKIAFVTGNQTASTGSTQQTVSYDDVGLTLKIRPNITPEKSVDMTVNLTISQLELDIINVQRARKNLDTTTHMIINDGQSIMLGGILFQNNEETQQKVPLLGDIPLLGEVFKHKRTEVTNSELLVFVTPYVVDDKKLEAIPQDPDQTPLEDSRGKLKTTLEQLRESLDEVLGKPYEPVEKKPGDKADAEKPADDAAGKTTGKKSDDAAKPDAEKPAVPVTTDKPVGPTAMKEN